MGTEGLSISDALAIAKDNDGAFGGNGAWVFFLFFLLAWGGNGLWGNRTGEFGPYATAASQQEILFGQQFQGLYGAINKVGDGLSSLGYAQLQQMTGDTASINNNITSEGRALQMQLAECCCGNKEATAQVRFDMANYNAATTAAIHAEGEATRALLQQNKIEALQGQINNLQLQNAVAGVVRYPMATTYSSGANPFCSCNCNCGY